MTLNPQFRLVARLSLGPKGAYVLIASLVIAMPLTARDQGPATAAAAAAIGYVFMCCAVPYAALHVRLLDHRRQMDLIRMVGARDDVTLFYLAAGGGWWIAGTGVVLVAVARAAGEPLSSLGLASSLLGMALGVVVLALPLKPSKRWSILLFIPAIGVMLGEGFVRYSAPLLFIAVGGALALTAACAPIAVRELARQTTGRRPRRALQVGRGRLFRKTSHPEFARMFSSSASSMWLLPAIGLTVMPVVAWWSARNAVRTSAPELLGAVLWALVAATALIASVRSRDEFVSGGIERMNLSGRRPTWSLAELSAGITAAGLTLIVPAVVTAALVAPKMTLHLLGWIALGSPGLLAIALSEGLSNRKLAVYVAPALAGFLALGGEARATWWVVPLASWIPIAVAVASMARPGTVPLQRGTAVLAIATVGACLGLLHNGWTSISWVASAMSLFAGLTTPGRSVNKWSWLVLATAAGWMSAAAAQAASAALHLPTSTRETAVEHPWVFAALFGAFAGAGTFYGTSAHFVGQGSRALSFALRAAPLVASLLVSNLVDLQFASLRAILFRPRRDLAVLFASMRHDVWYLEALVVAAIALVIAVLSRDLGVRERVRQAQWSTLAGAAGPLALLIAIGGWWFGHRWNEVRLARVRDLPELRRLAEQEQFSAAFNLARRIQPYVEDDPLWQDLIRAYSRYVRIVSEPDGGTVSYRPYGQPQAPWQHLGRTPIQSGQVPRDVLVLRIEKDGFVPAEDVGLLPRSGALQSYGPEPAHTYVLDTPAAQPPGMVHASPRGWQQLQIVGLEHLAPFQLETFWIDRTEVTNRDFKRFVDAGGYRNRRDWTQSFVRSGVQVSWDEAMTAFRDRTGQPGPATWVSGTYQPGQDDLPVSGVSWFEAAAYAAFAGKQLPTIFHWSDVADPRTTNAVLLPRGRFQSAGPLRVGQAGAVSRYGTQDIAGNVKEWYWNEAADERRYTLGGAWPESPSSFNVPDVRSPWDRDATLGFRCIKPAPSSPVPAALTARVPRPVHDFNGESPVDDRAFAGFKSHYESRHLDLAPRPSLGRNGWHEIVEINTAYGQERFTVHLALPTGGKPPYQTVVVFPTAAGLSQRARAGFANFDFRYLTLSGRAVAYPVYKSTFERHDDLGSEFPNQTTAYRDHVMMWSKDVQTTVDYLQTRADIAHDKIAYLGLGWGAAMGPILTATEPRFAVAILQNGGFYAQRALPEADAINFAPRVRIPTLMLNGQYDRFFPVDRSQRFLFNLLGVGDADKRWVLYPTDQGLPRQKMIADTVGWLDRYFGRVAVR